MCLFPKLITNKKYTKTKKNGGVIPPILDSRVTKVPVGCGKCMECRKQKSSEWQVRLSYEVNKHRNGKFITLTFNDQSITELGNLFPNLEGYPLDNKIATIAVRRFLERWRKKFKTSVKHWFITELGHRGTENLHIHGIIWTDVHADTVQKLWNYGFIWKGYETEEKINGWSKKLYVNQATVNYITKYINKQDAKHKNYIPKILVSNGIGSGYDLSYNGRNNQYKGDTTNETYRVANGKKVSLPRYYRNKIYTDEEKEKLWLQKLDSNKRWIMGIEVDGNNNKAYHSLWKEAVKRNKQLGYGDDTKNSDEAIAEQERRKELMEKRKQRLLKQPPAG